MQGVLRLAAVVGIKEVLQLAGLEDEHLQDLERFASDKKHHHHKGFHAWSFSRKSSTVRSATFPIPARPGVCISDPIVTMPWLQHEASCIREFALKCRAQVRDSSDTGSEEGSLSVVSMQSSHLRSPSRDDSMDLGERRADVAARRLAAAGMLFLLSGAYVA